MKKLFTLLSAVLITSIISAQIPKNMSYQCVLRNTGGTLLANQTVGIRISILQGSSSGTVVYQEAFNPNPSTNANGLLSIVIGSGVPSVGTFASIDWSSGLYYLKTETDPAGGTNYTINGVTQLLSVPYSMYSEKAGNGISLSSSPVSGDILFFNGTNWQLLSKGTNGQTLRLDNGLPNWAEPGYALPLVTTNPVKNILQTTATSGGNIISTGFTNITAYGVCWSVSQNPTTADSKTNDGTVIGTFNSSLTNLLPNTTYYVKAYAINGAGTAYGNQESFKSSGDSPTLITKDVTNILETTAIAGGTILTDGGATVNERGVFYGTSPDLTIYDKKIASGSGLGTYTVPLTILVPNVTYYVIAYAYNSTTKVYTFGETKSFTTDDAYYAGFEDGIPSGWVGVWTPSVGAPYEGFYCLKSLIPGDSVVFTRTITVPGQITFYHKSTGGYDSQGQNYRTAAMTFSIDNVPQPPVGSDVWTMHTYSITTPGPHKFSFKNNGGGYANTNTVFIDYFICPK